MSNRIKRISAVLGLFAMTVFSAGCENRGAVEKAGENLGRGLKNVGEEVDQAAGNVKRVIDNHARD